MPLYYCHDPDDIDFVKLRQDLIDDQFHNDRTTEELKTSFKNSFISVFTVSGDRCIGTARALSDQVCNCYVVDVWTQSSFRDQGIASTMMKLIIDAAAGQHVYLQTDSARRFYEKLGFKPQPEGMFLISGNWLNRSPVSTDNGST
jgi:predicted GNAT family acetyltransferase